MKNLFVFPLMMILGLSLYSCDKDDVEITPLGISEFEKSSLLHMLEEEKLARDVYTYLDELWGLNQFGNIKESEKTHLSYVASTLEMFDIEYNILPEGEFVNQELQELYNSLTEQAELSALNALIVGATIEDLDIADLDTYLDQVSSPTIVELYTRLQCGSKNHMRAFNRGIENNGSSYQPQYISQELFDEIISSQNEHCH